MSFNKLEALNARTKSRWQLNLIIVCSGSYYYFSLSKSLFKKFMDFIKIFLKTNYLYFPYLKPSNIDGV